MQVQFALDGSCTARAAPPHGQQHRDQDSDDGNHHKQFYERKSRSSYAGKEAGHPTDSPGFQ
jgi:hypothetical protein